jgi:hypothetical protein
MQKPRLKTGLLFFTMKHTTVIANDREFSTELIHRDSDPGSWIVRRWSRGLLFRKRISSDWFNDERQAAAFAARLTGKPERRPVPVTTDDEGRWQDDGGEGG